MKHDPKKTVTLPRNVRREIDNIASNFIVWFSNSPSKEEENAINARLFAFILERAEQIQTLKRETRDGVNVAGSFIKLEILAQFGPMGSKEIDNFKLLSPDARHLSELSRPRRY